MFDRSKRLEFISMLNSAINSSDASAAHRFLKRAKALMNESDLGFEELIADRLTVSKFAKAPPLIDNMTISQAEEFDSHRAATQKEILDWLIDGSKTASARDFFSSLKRSWDHNRMTAKQKACVTRALKPLREERGEQAL